MKNIIIGIVVLVILIIGGVVWFGKSSTPVVENSEPIKIGAIYAATGPAAKFGEISIKGVRDAAIYYTEVTGVPAEVIVEDSASDPKVGVSAAQKLFTVDKVKYVVIGTSAVSAAVAPVAEGNKGLLISDAALLGLTKDKNYTLQNFMPSLSRIPQQINANTAWKKVAIVYINDEFGNVWEKTIRESLTQTKVSQSFSFEKDSKEFRTQTAKIKQFFPDVIVVIGYGPALNQAFADMNVAQIKVPLITYLACTLPGVVTDARFSLEGQYSYEYPPISNAAIRTWVEKKQSDLNTFYTVAFENALLALTAAHKTGGTADDAINYLKNTPTAGLWGNVQFGKDGVVNRDLTLTRITNSKCEPVAQ